MPSIAIRAGPAIRWSRPPARCQIVDDRLLPRIG